VNILNSHPLLEQETHSIIQDITNRTIGGSESIPLKAVLAAEVPKHISQYFQCEVLKWLDRDVETSRHFSTLRASVPTVAHLTRIYIRTVAPDYVFDIREFTNTLENAVHFAENFVCRPVWTLEQFVFEQADRARFADLQGKFEYLTDDGYLPGLILEYMRNRKWQEISRDDFRQLAKKIDDQVVKQHNSRELAYLCRPIFEFVVKDIVIEGRAIPIRPLIVFFEDKGMHLLKEYIERICQIRGREQLTIEQLADIIDDLHSGSAATRLREHLPLDSTSESSEANELAEEQTLSIEPEGQQIENSPDQTIPISPEPFVPMPPQSTDRRNIPLSLTFSGMTGTSHPKPASSQLPDLKDVIDEQQRTRFIKSIFQRDEAYYNVVVETLNGMTTWRDASLYLGSFYNTGGVDPFEADVVEFTDLIQRRFSPQQ